MKEKNIENLDTDQDHDDHSGHHHHDGECCHGQHEPHVNANQKIGRNDPCICESGKKFKKCCLYN